MKSTGYQQPVTVRPCTGWRRWVFLQRVKLVIFLRSLPAIFSRRLGPGRVVAYLGRLLFFLGRLQQNKFVTIGKNTRLNMYVPGFPSRAFFTACDKFLVFDGPLPCATALISVTSACRFRCSHCYQRLDKGSDVAIDRLTAAVVFLQNQGVAFFNIEGGEPFLRFDRLLAVCTSIDHRSEIWINSTGDGISADRLRLLRATPVSTIMFSLHSARPERLNDFMGSSTAWITMQRGIALCHQEGIAVAFNVCLGREGYYNGELEEIMERAREFDAAMVQLIMPKSAGAWLHGGASQFSAEDIVHVKSVVHRYNHDKAYRSYPPISAQVNEEDPAMFGCTAGGTDRFYINAKGDVQPCEFLNLSFGSIAEEPFAPIFERMRAAFDPPGERHLCEACAPAIGQALRDQLHPVLPLNPVVSERIMECWDRGEETDLYRRLGGRTGRG